MIDLPRIRAELTAEFENLQFEVATFCRIFAETRFFGRNENFPNAHHGYLMACMGKVDVLSALWRGDVSTRGQTRRMVDFMEQYLHPGKADVHRVVVKMFRHTLMHTGALRFIYDHRADVKYTWRISFGEFASGIGHYTVTAEKEEDQELLVAIPVSTKSKSSKTKALNISIVNLVEDLKRAARAYSDDLDNSSILQRNYEKALPDIIIQNICER